MTKLKIALIATFRPIFQGDMKGVLKKSIEKISSLGKELDFDFIPFETGMETKNANIVTVLCDGGERYMQSRFWEEMVEYFEQYKKDRQWPGFARQAR